MILDTLCITQGRSLVTQDIETKHDRKDVKLLGTKKSTYVKVNTPSVNQV